MTDLEKPKRKPRAKKPPTQTAGVSGINGHGGMGETPEQPTPNGAYINWHKLVSLPAFEMFVFEQSGLTAYPALIEWVENRRTALGDKALYELYAKWHRDKGYWVNETPNGELK